MKRTVLSVAVIICFLANLIASVNALAASSMAGLVDPSNGGLYWFESGDYQRGSRLNILNECYSNDPGYPDNSYTGYGVKNLTEDEKKAIVNVIYHEQGSNLNGSILIAQALRDAYLYMPKSGTIDTPQTIQSLICNYCGSYYWTSRDSVDLTNFNFGDSSSYANANFALHYVWLDGNSAIRHKITAWAGTGLDFTGYNAYRVGYVDATTTTNGESWYIWCHNRNYWNAVGQYFNPDAQVFPTPYTDITINSYYQAAVNWATEHEITKGTTITTFSPDQACTRGQAASFLYRYAQQFDNASDTDTATLYIDVPADAYYCNSVNWCREQEITYGTTETTFSPNSTVTRAQFITFLWRYAGSPEVETTTVFEDVSATSYYAKAIAWAVERGITCGTSDYTFSPDRPCTRAQVVTFIYRYWQNS